MNLSDKKIQEFKNILEKESGKKISWEEACESARSLYSFVEICFEQMTIDQKRKQKLKKHPKGFHLEGVGYTCFICRDSISNEETWYDKWGIKCLTCQKAIDKKIIPASLAKNRDSWYSQHDLKSCFNIDKRTMNQFIKEEILKLRIILNESGEPHEHLFLIKDNKDTLPPKKLTEPRMVKDITKDGKEGFRLEPWYKFKDAPEKVKGYKIMNHLRFTYNKNDEKH